MSVEEVAEVFEDRGMADDAKRIRGNQFFGPTDEGKGNMWTALAYYINTAWFFIHRILEVIIPSISAAKYYKTPLDLSK